MLSGSKKGTKRLAGTTTECVVRLDRVVIVSRADLKEAIRRLRHFRTQSDVVLRNMDQPFGAYGRSRRMNNDATGTELFINYRPRFRRLAPLRVGVVPDDVKGLQRPELESILRAFEPHQLVIVEIAVDFSRRTE